MYKIKWVSKFNGACGYGTGVFSKQEAEQIAKQLNAEKDAICFHTAVLADGLTDYPGFQKGDVYIVAMAGGDGEEALLPIMQHVNRDWQRAYDDARGKEAKLLLSTPPEEWVDMLEVWSGDDIVATWSRDGGWCEY